MHRAVVGSLPTAVGRAPQPAHCCSHAVQAARQRGSPPQSRGRCRLLPAAARARRLPRPPAVHGRLQAKRTEGGPLEAERGGVGSCCMGHSHTGASLCRLQLCCVGGRALAASARKAGRQAGSAPCVAPTCGARWQHPFDAVHRQVGLPLLAVVVLHIVLAADLVKAHHLSRVESLLGWPVDSHPPAHRGAALRGRVPCCGGQRGTGRGERPESGGV